MADAIERALGEIKFDSDGLVPAIAQQHDTGEVLMVAWMNREAVRVTLAEGGACYWSRSRGKLWRKGETRGRRSASSNSASIATATRCCCWSIRRASPATPAAATAFSAPGATANGRKSPRR